MGIVDQDSNNVSSYIAQYPVLKTAQSALYASLASPFNQTLSEILLEHPATLLLMREGCSYK